MIDRREFVRRVFAIGAGFTAGGLLVRREPTISTGWDWARMPTVEETFRFNNDRLSVMAGPTREALEREIERHRRFMLGRQWITVDELNAVRLPTRDEIVRVANLFDS